MIAAPLAYPTGAFAESPSQVVATVGSHKITEAQVDAQIKPQMDAIESKIYDLKHAAIESLAQEFLLEEAAQKEHMSVAEYTRKFITDKTPHVTDAEAKKYFDDHKGKSPIKYEQIRDRLIGLMQSQRDQQQRDLVITGLSKGRPLTILLKPPRTEVAIAGRPSLGSADAPVTLIEFSDFQCPFCKRAEPTVEAILKKYGKQLRFVYVDFPLPMHSHALDAAKAGQCAFAQKKFWPFHDRLFADQSKLAPADLKATAKKLGLDSAKFDQCLDEAKTQAAVESEMEQGKRLGIDGTPTFYVNGRQLVGAQPIDAFTQMIDEELALKGARGTKQARAN